LAVFAVSVCPGAGGRFIGPPVLWAGVSRDLFQVSLMFAESTDLWGPPLLTCSNRFFCSRAFLCEESLPGCGRGLYDNRVSRLPCRPPRGTSHVTAERQPVQALKTQTGHSLRSRGAADGAPRENVGVMSVDRPSVRTTAICASAPPHGGYRSRRSFTSCAVRAAPGVP
jgi:hypothetical protein